MNKKKMFVLAVVIIISMIMGGLQVAIAEPTAEPEGLLQVGNSDQNDSSEGEIIVIRDQNGVVETRFEPFPESLSQPATDVMPQAPDMLGPDIPYLGESREETLSDSNLFQTPRGIDPVTAPFPIADTAAWEYHPSVAYGFGNYLVVYSRSGHIHGSVYDNFGTLLRTFLIDNWRDDFGVPRVAFNRTTGYFVVVYHRTSVDEITVATVSAEDGQRVFELDFPGVGYKNPDVACVNPDNTCIVVFETNGFIQGRYITINSTNGSFAPTTPQNFSTASGERPFIAYGGGNFAMITFTWTSGGERFPLYNAVWASHQSTAFIGASNYVRNFSGAPWEGTDKYATGITYDPCTDKFVLIFDHIHTPGEIIDVYGAAIGASLPFANHWNGLFAWNPRRQRSGGISFVAEGSVSQTCGAMNKLVVAYTDLNQTSIYAVEVVGNNDTTDPSYSNSISSSDHFLVHDLSPDYPHWRPAIFGSGYWGHMFIAYTLEKTSPLFNYNVWGRIIDLQEYRTLSVSKAGTGDGRVTSDPDGIDCGPTCQGEWPYNMSATLFASPSPGSQFTGWSGACSGTGWCVLSMDTDKNVVANFEASTESKIYLPLILR